MKLFKIGNKDFTLEDLYREIYQNSVDKRQKFNDTFDNLSELIKTLNDAVILMPTLVDMQGVGVKNDEQLLKLAAIIGRGNKRKGDDDGSVELLLSDDDKRLLLEEAKKYVQGEPGPNR